jgi:nucleoside 2-deoxyribosyltransferase
MRIYISYKFSGSDPKELKQKLTQISEALNHETFIFNRDLQEWGNRYFPEDMIMKKAMEEIEASDALLAFVNTSKKSEGMLLETGFAKAKEKPLILVIKKGLKFRFLRDLADFTIEFDDFKEILPALKNADFEK